MKIPSQPWQHNAFKFGITFLIVISSIWSASGLEITLERILDAPRQIGILVGAMFPLDLSDEALDRIANSNEALCTLGINSIYDAEEYLSHMVDVRRVGEYA